MSLVGDWMGRESAEERTGPAGREPDDTAAARRPGEDSLTGDDVDTDCAEYEDGLGGRGDRWLAI